MAVAPVIWCVPYRRGAGSKLTILIINVFPLIVMPFGKKNLDLLLQFIPSLVPLRQWAENFKVFPLVFPPRPVILTVLPIL